MASLPPFFPSQFFNGAEPAAAGRLYTYESGTTTPKATYTDQAQATPNTNPIVLDQFGRCDLWLGDGEYTLELRDADGALIDAWDDVAGSATGEDLDALRAELADDSGPTQGADLIGYEGGTVKDALDSMADASAFIGSGGVVDQYADLMAFYAALPIGAVMYIKGAVLVQTKPVFNRRINIICESQSDYILVDVGASNDGVLFMQSGALDETGVNTVGGINGIRIRLNVYGRAAACKDAVVLYRLDRSDVFVNVYAGAAAYAVRMTGCLINTVEIQSTANYRPPISTPDFQVDHLLVEKDTTYSVASNTNDFWVNFEGGRHGITQTAMPGEGANTYEGEIEGLTGNPWTIGDCLGVWIRNLRMEENRLGSSIAAAASPDLQFLRVGPGIINFRHTNYATYPTSGRLTIDNAQNAKIDGYYGDLTVGAGCFGTKLGQVQGAATDSIIVLDPSAVIDEQLTNSTARAIMAGGPGFPTMENIWLNPFFDIWNTNGPLTGPPDGVVCPTATAVKDVGSYIYPGNPSQTSMVVTASGTTITNGAVITPTQQPWRENTYVSVMVAIYTNSVNGGVAAHIYDGASYNTFGVANAVGGWTVLRGCCKLIAGNNWNITLSGWNGTAYVSGFQWAVGACAIVQGPIPPKDFSNSAERMNYVAPNVSYAPPFIGARAYVSGTGKWYLAKGTASSADWIILN